MKYRLSLGIIVAIVAVILIGIYAYIRLALGIDIFGTISTLKKLGSDFELSAIVDYEYTQTDVEQAFNQFDQFNQSTKTKFFNTSFKYWR